MGATNKTTNYSLPQWIGTDKPTFLGDMNDAFLKIDEAIVDVSGDATTALTEAGTAKQTVTEIETEVKAISPKVESAATTAATALSTAESAQSTANSFSAQISAVKSVTDALTNWVNVPITMNSNVSSGSWTCQYNPTLKLLNIYGSITFSSYTTTYAGYQFATLNLPFTLASARTVQSGCIGAIDGNAGYGDGNTPITFSGNNSTTIAIGTGVGHARKSLNINVMLNVSSWQ